MEVFQEMLVPLGHEAPTLDPDGPHLFVSKLNCWKESLEDKLGAAQPECCGSPYCHSED